ncbi:MAG: NAD(P)H:quinone oxidoreductase [Dehalococcoidales bacterium]
MKVKVIFYSMFGHTYRLAEAIAQGAAEVPGSAVEILQIQELVPVEILEKSGARKARDIFCQIPIAKPVDMVNADAIIFGAPTRFGNMCAQMRNFLDQTSGLWSQNAFVGKVGSAFTSSATQHGGQETTLLTFYITLLHLGMIIVGLPYTENRQTTMSEITGESPYGVSSISGASGSRMPSENELAMAKFQGKYVTTVTAKLLNSHIS